MRIIQLAYERLPKRQARGGGELGTYQTLCALTELGHEVDLVVCGKPMEVERAARERVREVHWIEPTTPPPLSAAGLAGSFQATMKPPALVTGLPPDSRMCELA